MNLIMENQSGKSRIWDLNFCSRLKEIILVEQEPMQCMYSGFWTRGRTDIKDIWENLNINFILDNIIISILSFLML